MQFPSDWYTLVGEEFEKPYFQALIVELKHRKAQGEQIYPADPDIFRAFWITPLESVRVVLLGQDPYHGDGQAHGLSFSVPDGVPPPPSLKNIFKEIEQSLGSGNGVEIVKDVSFKTAVRDGDSSISCVAKFKEIGYIPAPKTGNLTHRAEQGVLLLNAILTVKAHEAASHHKLGREQFTDSVIQRLSDHHDHLVFLLRGSFAHSKKSLIDTTKHLILEAPHPSPLSAHRGFLGCGHFRLANEWLQEHGIKPIQWVG